MRNMYSRKRLTIIPIIALIVVAVSPVVLISVGAAAPRPKVITDPVSYPLPTLPEPVLLGGDFRVEVIAGEDASGWTASLSSDYGSASLDLINNSYSGGIWTIFFEIPGSLHPDLYSLDLAYDDGGEPIEYTQSRCVWVLEEWPESITFSQITDTHMPYGKEVFAQIVHELNLVDPDMLILTGDTVDIETTASSWGYLQGIMSRLELPIFMLPGNHDYAGADSAIYQKYGGKKTYSVVIGDFLILGLDSHSGGFIDLEQLQWAESVLQAHPDKVKIIANHHGLLTSEFEDDMGTVKGGEISGSWESIEDLWDVMYFTWWEKLDEAKEFLRLVETYDVRVIVSGHVHRDVIYILNGAHYFISTGPSGGGLPEGQYQSSRIVTVDSGGNVELDDYAIANLHDPPNSIPTGLVSYWYGSANDGTEAAVSATVVNGQERELDGAKLEFVVSVEYPVDAYQFSSTAPTSFSVTTTGAGHLFVGYFNIPASSTIDVTLSAVDDGDEPLISVEVPGEYVEGVDTLGTISVVDGGWGVKEMTASYSTDEGATWTPMDASIHPVVTADEYDITIPEVTHDFTVPADSVVLGLIVSVEAWDYAGNHATYETGDLASPPPPPPPTAYTLTVESDPISGIPITVDGGSETTPYSADLEEGAHTISVPAETTVSGKNYAFARWADGSTEAERTVNLDSDKALTASYEEVETETPEEPEEPTEEEEPGPLDWIPLPTGFALIGVLLGAAVIVWLNLRK